MSTHKDWVRDEKDGKDQETHAKRAVESLREGYWTLITQAINELRLEQARTLLDAGKNYLGIVYPKLLAYFNTINKHVIAGELALEKPFPRVDSAVAGQAIQDALRTSPSPGKQKRIDRTNGDWSIEQIFEAHDQLFKLIFEYDYRRDPNTYLLKHSIRIIDGQYRSMLNEQHVTFQDCLEALSRFLSTKPE